jgi:hypothetical protein
LQQPFKSSDLEGCFYDLLQDGLKNGMSSVIINTMKSERKYRGMGFIDAYKRLEKLCGEILNDDRRISAYIDEMVNAPRGSYLVSGWEDDLKKLKHYRWIRNQIVHNPDCTEENMCDSNDTQWILNFYARIMNQTDPLTLYHKAIHQQYIAPRGMTEWQSHVPNKECAGMENGNGCAISMAITITVLVLIVIFLVVIS